MTSRLDILSSKCVEDKEKSTPTRTKETVRSLDNNESAQEGKLHTCLDVIITHTLYKTRDPK